MRRNEAALAARLRRMRFLATGLLAGMAVIFVATSMTRDLHPAVGVLFAFSEAALIGGLADWFAVTALFRRPLGLPIPHTAIIPSRKDDIGRALARFVSENFLIRDAVARRLEGTDLAARLAAWLGEDRVAARLSRDAGVALDWLVRTAQAGELGGAVKTSLREILERIPASAVVATFVEVLVSGNHAQALIDALVRVGRDQLERNKTGIREHISDRSPWWLPKFVDRKIYDQLVAELERILDAIGNDPEHPARRELNVRLSSIQHALATDPDFLARGDALRDELLDHPAVGDLAHDVWQRAQAHLHESLADPDSAVRLGIERELVALGRTLARDAELRARLNRWLGEALVYVVDTYREQLTEVISDTVERWDAESTAQRIELHIGSDLQFIRINGTLVGGLVGVALYLVLELGGGR